VGADNGERSLRDGVLGVGGGFAGNEGDIGDESRCLLLPEEYARW